MFPRAGVVMVSPAEWVPVVMHRKEALGTPVVAAVTEITRTHSELS